MKILFITQFLPYPTNTGGKVKSYAVIKVLSQIGQIDLACFVDKPEDADYGGELEKHCRSVKTFHHPIISKAHGSLKIQGIKSLFSRKPFRVCKHYSRQMENYLLEMLKNNKYDMLYFEHDVMMQYLDKLRRFGFTGKVVYDEVDITSIASWRNFRVEKKLVDRMAYLLDTIKWRFYENNIYQKADIIYTISEVDRNRIEKRNKNKGGVYYLPIPLETKPLFHFNNKRLNIFMLGLLAWKPNDDGFWWFYREVLPLIKKEIPEITFTVGGAHASREIIKAAENDPSLRLLGYVEDIDKEFGNASVFVVPIRSGGGIRIKLLDAMRRGVPVVSTGVGAEGIGVEDKKEIYIADKPKDFAFAVERIINYSKTARKLSQNGLSFVRKNYCLKKTLLALKQNGF